PRAKLNGEQAAALDALREALVEAKLLARGEQPAVMLRITDAGPATARSLRRAVQDVLSLKAPE
ncbi:MAG: hypothetical protein LC659_11620, partial [Myxococcales bacterium]|nr:hypothetical protein [Myxococcales bacterium]